MTRKPSSEADLARIVIAWLEALGADVYQEVSLWAQGSRADIVARVGAELWIIETKTSVSLALIEQAMLRRRFAHRVYVAAPAGKARAGIDLCKELGIGLLNVAEGVADHVQPRVTELAPSRRWNTRPLKLAGKLCPEHKTSAAAGTSGGGHWTPFLETCKQLRRVVGQRPDGVEIKTAVASIAHHYVSSAGARSSLAGWVAAGKVPGVRIESGLLYPVQTDPAPVAADAGAAMRGAR